ncbi:MAG: leucine-rich repeat protein [Bacteroidales bacterium]|jgi:hypothetical protein|nr:leucine-rich repeat protein [Bacteroidales bacterium]
MKKIILIAAAALTVLGGCKKYDDSALWTELEKQNAELEAQNARIAAIETWQQTANGNIAALQTIVAALQNSVSITSVTEITDAPGGYIIAFSDNSTATVYNGANGENGENGTDGATPQISVAQFPAGSGTYFWTLNSEWLTDDDGDKIPVTGAKGNDGATGASGSDGATGASGVTPRLRINGTTNIWEICTTGVCTEEGEWTSTGVKATGDDGAPGAQGDAIFAGVDATDPNYVVFTLADGATTISVPQYKGLAFALTVPPTIFTAGQTQQLAYTSDAAAIRAVDVPAGWTVKVNSATIDITAKFFAPENLSVEITLLYSDDAGNVKMHLIEATVEPPADPAGVAAYLASTGGGSASDPIYLPMDIDLDNAGGNGWTDLLSAIQTAGKYIDLDLSACDMNGTEFDPGTANGGEEKIVSLILPDEAEGIVAGDYLNPTFQHFTALKSVSGAGVTTIGDYAFTYRYTLTTAYFPKATTIGDGAFGGCNALSTANFPQATDIGEDAFFDCFALTMADFPKVRTIGWGAFMNCSTLATANFPEATTVGESAFLYCYALATANFPEATDISDGAFDDCEALTSITIRGSCTISSTNQSPRFGAFITYYSGVGGTYSWNGSAWTGPNR